MISDICGYSLNEESFGEEIRIWMFYGYDRVLRSLFMDNILYTISSHEVIMSGLDDLGTPLNSIALPSAGYRWSYPPVE